MMSRGGAQSEGPLIPAGAEDSLYIERLDKGQIVEFTKWAADNYDHIVVRGNDDTGWYTVWCWVLPEPVQQVSIGEINFDPCNHNFEEGGI